MKITTMKQPTAMSKYILTIMMMLAGILSCAASEIEAADSAYYKGNYDEAAALYSEVMEREGISAGLLYNLGNAYYKLGRTGEAMVCYERARKLEPGNKAINQNLNFLRQRVTDANKGALQGKQGNVEPDQDTFIEGLYRMIAWDTKSNNWAVFAVMAFIIFLGAMALYMFTPNVLARKTGFFSGLVFLGFTIIFIIFAYLGAANYDRQDQAVLMDFTTELLEQPDTKSTPASTPLHKGTKLKILESKTGDDGTEWLKVKLNSNNVGWVKKEGIEVI